MIAMGLRGIARDFLSLYVGYKVMGIWFFNSEFSSGLGWAGLSLFVLAVWFLFERVGIIPKYW
ncbi:MAG: hypothetical protein KAJ24_00925 [Candidatus Aenigmarchaeota archaeon]|nr:hypothetical protein [Candidatus Aenigmarchaeota archaeon]